ncbi:MAG: hypothetical protein OSB09_10775 [Planctomycetota bacterium]|nr:hypothetical protein [Planctomycetota bacterium]
MQRNCQQCNCQQRNCQQRILGVLSFLILVLALTPASSEAQLCYETHWLTVSDQDDVVRRVNPVTLEVEAEFPMSIAGAIEIDALRGIAIHPVTGNWYLLAMTSLPPSPAPSPWLMEYNPIDDTLQLLGFTVLDFNDLDITPNGEIRAITNTLTTGNSNYCELSTITGGPTDLCLYPGSNGGDSIALGSGGTVFRASGGYVSGTLATFEAPSTPPGGASPCDTSVINISTTLAEQPIRSLTYQAQDDAFIWVQGDTARSAYSVTASGAETFLGTFDHDVNSISLIEVVVACPVGDEFIRGDCNIDMGVNVADAVFLLSSLFVPGSTPIACRDAGDVNDDGGVNVADAVFLLSSLFVPGSASIPAPNILDGCGSDPTTGDSLACTQSGC